MGSNGEGKITGIIVGKEEGEWPNGTIIKKRNSEPGDGHQDGDQGVVVGALSIPEKLKFPDKWFYWVKWDDMPDVPVGVREHRIKPV